MKENKKCSFCRKPLTKKEYRMKDKFNSYVICDQCMHKVTKYQNEYDTEAKKINAEYEHKLETLSNKLRKKYGLKKH